MNQYWYIIVNWSPYLIQISQFPLMVFLLQEPSRRPQDTSHVSLRPLLVEAASRLCLVLMTLTALRSTGQVCSRMSLSWHWSDVFLIIMLWLWTLGRKTPEIKCHSHHTQSTWPLCWWEPWPPVWGSMCLSGFSTIEAFFPFFYTLWKEDTASKPYLGGGSCTPPLRGRSIYIRY